MYQREPDALARSLDDPLWTYTADVSVLDQLEQIESVEQRVQQSIRSKTLLKTAGKEERHHHLRRELGDSREHGVSSADKLRHWLENRTAAEYTDPVISGDYDPYWNQVGVELLRLVAERLDGMTQLIERVKLDNFDDLLPPHFHRIFAECHLNLALGNATTSCVLAGAMLEYGLREKCPEHSTNKTRIKEVEAKGIWSKDDAGIAWEVLGARIQGGSWGCRCKHHQSGLCHGPEQPHSSSQAICGKAGA